MTESGVVQGYHVLTSDDVTARQVTVTPSTAPVRGRALLEATHLPVNRSRVLAAEVQGAALVIALPRWARVGNVLHWTGYES